MHIQKLAIQNFRNHRNSTIELDKMNIFIGRNNSGKSSILAAIEWPTGRNCDRPGRPGAGDLVTRKEKLPGGLELASGGVVRAMPPHTLTVGKSRTSRKDRPPSTTIWGRRLSMEINAGPYNRP